MGTSEVRLTSGRHAAAKAGALILFAGLPAMFGTAPAAAAIIDSIGITVFPGSSTGTIGPVGVTPAPNNDNAGAANPNVVPYTIFYNSLGVVDVEFNLENSGGTTEYGFTQALINNTGTPWSGFRYELGFGVGATFVRSTMGDLLDFDAPDADPAPTSTAFAVLGLGPDTLDWSGGNVPSVGSVFQTFAIDLPDNLVAFNPSGENSFTLRQFPITADTVVPEPGSLSILLGAALGILIISRRRPQWRPPATRKALPVGRDQ